MSAQQPTRPDERDRTLPAHERAAGGHPGDQKISVDAREDDAEQAEFLRACLDEAPVCFLALSLDGTVLKANAAFFELSGLPSPLPAGYSLQQILPRAAAIFYETHLVPVLLMRGALNELALDLIGPSGTRIPVLANAKLWRNAEGKPRYIALAMMVIQERRQYERELLQARKGAEQIAEIVRRSTDAVLTLSPKLAIQTWNRGAEQIFGYDQDEALGRSFVGLLFPESERDEVRRAVALLVEGQELTKDFVGVDKSGRSLDLSISFTPHMEAPGVLVASSAIIRDITSRRRTELALIQSEKLASVGRLASSIAHEINNPLESVTNLLYILESEVKEPGAHALVLSAQQELARVSQIAAHTLRFHRQSTAPSQVDLRTLFDSVLGLYHARLAPAGITVDLARIASAPLFCYDGELRQIFANLIANAFDAMRSRGGRLTIRSRDATLWSSGAAGVRITIADTGAGMDRSVLSRAFEPFFTTKGEAGTGLGLWITQELVTKNGGTIRARSRTGPGKSGTVFVLSFPHRPPARS